MREPLKIARCLFKGRMPAAVLIALFLVFWTQGLSRAVDKADDLWSFKWNNLPVEDVLKELIQATGVNVFTNGVPENKRVTKSYENETIEQIIRDVFRGTNHTLIWNYGKSGLESIGISFFDQGAAGPSQVSREGRTDTAARPRPSGRSPNRPLPNRAVVSRGAAPQPGPGEDASAEPVESEAHQEAESAAPAESSEETPGTETEPERAPAEEPPANAAGGPPDQGGSGS